MLGKKQYYNSDKKERVRQNISTWGKMYFKTS